MKKNCIDLYLKPIDRHRGQEQGEGLTNYTKWSDTMSNICPIYVPMSLCWSLRLFINQLMAFDNIKKSSYLQCTGHKSKVVSYGPVHLFLILPEQNFA